MGQGDINTTPLQMANFTAAIANRGFFYTPHIVHKIEGQPIKDSNFTIPKKTLVDPKHFETVLRGMRNVFTMGTARALQVKDFAQLGKTGTAQNSQGQDHSLFVLAAPADKPKIVVAAIVENAHYGATWAGPMSSLVAELYLTDTIKRQYLLTKMKNQSFQSEYNRQWINYLKRKGLYIEPVKKDTIEPKQIVARN